MATVKQSFEDEIKQKVIKNYKPNKEYGQTPYNDLNDKIKALKFSSSSELTAFCLENGILKKNIRNQNYWNIEIDTYFFECYLDELYKYEKKKTKSENSQKHLPELEKYGLKVGDRVQFKQVDSFMNLTEHKGTIFLKNGIPYIRLDYKAQMRRGNRVWTSGICKWNKAWKKAEQPLQTLLVQYIKTL